MVLARSVEPLSRALFTKHGYAKSFVNLKMQLILILVPYGLGLSTRVSFGVPEQLSVSYDDQLFKSFGTLIKAVDTA